MIYFRKYGRNLSQDANESLESSDQPFPPPSSNRRRTRTPDCFEEDEDEEEEEISLTLSPPALLCRVLPRPRLSCQKLFPLEIYRPGENRGVISGRAKQREIPP